MRPCTGNGIQREQQLAVLAAAFGEDRMVQRGRRNHHTFLETEELVERYQGQSGVIEATYFVLTDGIKVLGQRHHRGIHAHDIDIEDLLGTGDFLVKRDRIGPAAVVGIARIEG